MKTAYQINTATNLSKAISAVDTVKTYLESKKKRGQLASLLLQVIGIGSEYPPRIMSMTQNTAKMLYKNVSNTCPACVSKANMTKYIELALRDLKTYNTHLVEWLGDPSIFEEPKSVHDLKPTEK